MKKLKILRNALCVVTLVFFTLTVFSYIRVRMEDAKYGYKGNGHYADAKLTAYNYLCLELSVLDYANRVFAALAVLWIILGVVSLRRIRR